MGHLLSRQLETFARVRPPVEAEMQALSQRRGDALDHYARRFELVKLSRDLPMLRFELRQLLLLRLEHLVPLCLNRGHFRLRVHQFQRVEREDVIAGCDLRLQLGDLFNVRVAPRQRLKFALRLSTRGQVLRVELAGCLRVRQALAVRRRLFSADLGQASRPRLRVFKQADLLRRRAY